MAEKDEFVNNDEVLDIVKQAWKNGVDIQAKVYSGVNHAFLNTKRKEVYNEKKAKDAWNMAVDFFRNYLK
jgi:carboxymethylenebutenolidase